MKCDSPITVRLKQPIYDQKSGSFIYSVPVRCGKCLPCLNHRVESWAFRLEQESLKCKSAHFVTLTYNTDHVPLTKKGFMTLNKKHLQQYVLDLKKLTHYEKVDKKTEKEAKKVPLVYYGVGEYGGHKKRPHYHLIIFNSTDADIRAVWKYGNVFIASVERGSIKYVLKYIEKKDTRSFIDYDGQMEFAIFSRNIGKNFINEKNKNFYVNNLENNYIYSGRYKFQLPRYYRDRFLSEDQKKEQIKIISKVSEENENKEKGRIEMHGINYDFHVQSMKTQRYNKLMKIPKRKDV